MINFLFTSAYTPVLLRQSAIETFGLTEPLDFFETARDRVSKGQRNNLHRGSIQKKEGGGGKSITSTLPQHSHQPQCSVLVSCHLFSMCSVTYGACGDSGI